MARVATILAISVAMLRLIGGHLLHRGLLHGRRGRHILAGPLDDLVELATIKPDAAALRALINLDALALAHHERDFADWAGHGMG